MKKYSIDIHAHCSLKPYNNQYPDNPSSLWPAWKDEDIECDIQSKHILSLFVKKILRTTQTTMQQAAEGNVKIVGLSIMTFEAGWGGERISGKRKSLLSCLTGISKDKLKTIRDYTDDDQIYKDTENEFRYLFHELEKSHTDGNNKVWNFRFLTRSILKKINDGELDLDQQNTIYILLNIEGLQTLGITSKYLNEHDFALRHDRADKLKKRINYIKNTWPVIPQYITLCHHFGNGLAGHAPSIQWSLKLLGVKQKAFMGKGLTAKGKEVIDEMLGDVNRPILADIKHLSPKARIEFYEYIKEDIPNKFGKNYPVICSHTGIIGDDINLAGLKNYTGKEEKLAKGYLNGSTINMCKEDLEKISASNGLVGIQIDLKRLAGKEYLDKYKEAVTYDALNQPVEDEVEQKRLSCEIVWANIFTAMVWLNKKTAWKLFCIGSDYDGIVSFLPGYPTMSEYGRLKEDMMHVLENMNFKYCENITIYTQIKDYDQTLNNQVIKHLMFGYTAEELVDMVFSTNAVAFWSKHYTDQQLDIENF